MKTFVDSIEDIIVFINEHDTGMLQAVICGNVNWVSRVTIQLQLVIEISLNKNHKLLSVSTTDRIFMIRGSI